ncbi:hypothetical protein B0T10DRAFT_496470 [Thelonectria olida]|uniref:Secreted protein n=1 Tax=Thelonectria olida TaxID=1576542 RepID=A0A9P8VXV1_9HYPO|nr:hypothetical protein B0T10DRAFT_496470 [Thelonectria olida]
MACRSSHCVAIMSALGVGVCAIFEQQLDVFESVVNRGCFQRTTVFSSLPVDVRTFLKNDFDGIVARCVARSGTERISCPPYARVEVVNHVGQNLNNVRPTF